MFFKDIIGQKGVTEQLRRCVDEGRLAHALLITGPAGNGKLPVISCAATATMAMPVAVVHRASK